MDMNKIVVAVKDTKSKGVLNNLLLEWFNELGGAENNAVDTMTDVLKEAGIKLKDGSRKSERASVIGKLGVMGVKTIVKKKVAKKKNPDEPTKKELIVKLVNLLDVDIANVDTINNMRKADISCFIKAVELMKKA